MQIWSSWLKWKNVLLDSEESSSSAKETIAEGKDIAFWFLRFVSCNLVLRFGPAFCLKTSCVLPKDKLRFAVRLVAFCFKARCVMLQSSLHFASRQAAFCFKTSCVLSQDSCDLSHGCTAFCLLLKTLSAFWGSSLYYFIKELSTHHFTNLDLNTKIKLDLEVFAGGEWWRGCGSRGKWWSKARNTGERSYRCGGKKGKGTVVLNVGGQGYEFDK
nr:hypothetical protein [Tanacetum cinerariifolium]